MARKNPKLDKIYDVFDKHKVDIDRDSIWEVQGTPVVKHKDVERLGAAIGIKWTKPEILRAERDEAVILVMGEANGKTEWSIGEALISKENEVGGNYKVKGKMAAYPYAMAEKRAKDRVILKLADLHGDAYSSEEADDFNQDPDNRSNDRRDDRRDERRPAANDDKPPAREASVSKEDGQAIVQHWVKQIDEMTRTKQAMDIAASKEFIADMKKLSSNGEDYVMGKLSDKSQELKRAAHAG
ncbi:trna delta -isopentenylpyrophosphate transferase [Bradyrhizobium elkanii]